jgi:uncharacterized protein
MQWTKKNIPLQQLTSGETLNLTVHTIKGHAGPHVHIQSSVHGAEIQGNAVILLLMEKLKSLKLNGSITFIPLANPFGTNNKHGTYTYGRYNPITGHNWNRNYVDIINATKTDLSKFCEEHIDLPWQEIKFKYKQFLADLIDSYIEKLTLENKIQMNNKVNLILQKEAITSDGVLDLHTGPVATRYLYAAEYTEAIAKHLLIPNILVIPHEFGGAMDEASFMPWVHLIEAFKKAGREILCDVEAFTLEYGSEETFSLDDAQADVECILNYLRYKGMLDGEVKKIQGQYSKLANFQTLYSPIAGLVDYKKAPGESYDKGQLLANIYQLQKLDPQNPIESTVTPLYASEAGIIINRFPSSAVHEGVELFQMITNVYHD